MNALRIKTTVGQDHALVLPDLPLAAGQSVEVLILTEDVDVLSKQGRFPLRNQPISYPTPFESAADEADWEALK